MDSLTHAAIGACIGELTLGKKLGRHALWLGALAQNLPDMDAVAALWLPFSNYLLVHRGITHSFFFAGLLSLLLAFLLSKWSGTRRAGFSVLLPFLLGQVLLHDLLDTCNAYGTGLLLPFHQARYSWQLLYVADPLFTFWPVLAVLALLLIRRQSQAKSNKVWATLGLFLPLCYLGYARVNKVRVDQAVEASLTQQNLKVQDYITTPTAFNNWLWYVVAASENGYHIGYRSVFEKPETPIRFTFYPRNDKLLTRTADQTEVEDLRQFAAGYYTVQRQQDTLVFNVLRFGQVMGWRDTGSPFAFHYYLEPKLDNTLAVQRGRFKGWDAGTVRLLFHRIFTPEKAEVL